MPFQVNGKWYEGRGTGDSSGDPIITTPEQKYPSSGIFIDRSTSTNPTPLTLTQLMAANAMRVRWFVQNPSTTSILILYYGTIKLMELDPRDLIWRKKGEGDWCDRDAGIIQVASPDASVPVIAHEA